MLRDGPLVNCNSSPRLLRPACGYRRLHDAYRHPGHRFPAVAPTTRARNRTLPYRRRTPPTTTPSPPPHLFPLDLPCSGDDGAGGSRNTSLRPLMDAPGSDGGLVLRLYHECAGTESESEGGRCKSTRAVSVSASRPEFFPQSSRCAGLRPHDNRTGKGAQTIQRHLPHALSHSKLADNATATTTPVANHNDAPTQQRESTHHTPTQPIGRENLGLLDSLGKLG